MNRFPMSRFGPKVNPIGEYVRYDAEYKGRILLGEVTGVRYQDFPPCGFVCTVEHFNGEPWPFEPRLACLEWVKQDEWGLVG